MRNLHLIPTEKPSRLHLKSDGFYLTKEENSFIPYSYPQNIYITSDEEIKKGDWVYVKTPNIYGGNVIAKSIGNSNGCWADHILTETTDEKGYHPSHCVKIILTTDQDLIKDGVQAIDDEFLEWFVKNPSCEEVDIKKLLYKVSSNYQGNRFNGYKIIIPKEEAKQVNTKQIMYNIGDVIEIINPTKNQPKLFKTHKVDIDFGVVYYYELNGKEETIGFSYIKKVEPKQETLEEAKAQAWIDFAKTNKDVDMYSFVIGYDKGAKWQQEQDKNKYSEEEVINILNEYGYVIINEDKINSIGTIKKWFEQFKKK